MNILKPSFPPSSSIPGSLRKGLEPLVTTNIHLSRQELAPWQRAAPHHNLSLLAFTRRLLRRYRYQIQLIGKTDLFRVDPRRRREDESIRALIPKENPAL